MESERAPSSLSRAASAPSDPSGELSLAAASLVAAAAAVVVYLGGLHNPFVYDDHRVIVENPSIRDLRSLWAVVSYEIARPLTNVSYALDYARTGLQPFGYHVTNVVLHVVNAALLARVSWRLAGDAARVRLTARPAAAGTVAIVAAALFAVHPLMSSAVGYIAARPELLCAALLQLALLAGRRWLLSGGWVWATAMTAWWLLALTAKEVAAMFPFVLLVFDWCFMTAPTAEGRRRRRWTHALLVTATLAAGLARLALLLRAEHPGDAGVAWSLVPVLFDGVVRYVGLLVFPNGQTIFHAVALPPWGAVRTWVEIAAVVLLAVGAVRVRRSWPAAAFGVWWFLLLLMPSSLLVVLDRGEPMAEHRVYTASLGLFVLVGSGAAWLATHAPRWSSLLSLALKALLVVLMLSLAGRTLVRTAVWASPVDLWSEAMAKAPDHWLPHQLLGEALHATGRREEAIGAFRHVIRLRPEEPAAYQKLALSYLEMGRVPDAKAAFESLREVDPRSAIAANGLGAVALVSGQPEEARRWFQQALELDPGNVPARQALASMEQRRQ